MWMVRDNLQDGSQLRIHNLLGLFWETKTATIPGRTNPVTAPTTRCYNVSLGFQKGAGGVCVLECVSVCACLRVCACVHACVRVRVSLRFERPTPKGPHYSWFMMRRLFAEVHP
jgi:hypothetical protein